MSLLECKSLSRAYLLIDALDECTAGLQDIVRFVSRCGLRSKIRWLLTSRNEPYIREQLEYNALGTSLELHSSHVLVAVNRFIDLKIQDLSQRKSYDPVLQSEAREYLRRNAQGTFLWVALVCKELGNVRAVHAKSTGVKRTMVTAIECISADGRSLLQLIIWPASTHRSNWTTYPSPRWHFACSENGYNNFKISLELAQTCI